MDLRDRLLQGYYFATPLFFLADVLLGWNVRLAGLDAHDGLRHGYYLLCLACAAAVYGVPRATALLGLLEGACTLVILMLGVLLPYLAFADAAASEQGATGAPPLREAVANLMLSGGAWALALSRNPLLELRPR